MAQAKANHYLGIQLKRAIRSAPLTHVMLSRHCGLAPCQISWYLNGKPFGDRVRARVLRLGALLGVPAEVCTREKK